MGPKGSLQKLVTQYRQRSGTGESVPTTRLRTLGEWSTQHRWQERCKARIADEEEMVREAERKRAAALRKRLMTAIEADMSLYAQKVGRGEAVLAEDAVSLERMTKLYFQLAGDPLAEKSVQEHTGPNGGPIAHHFVIEQFGDDDHGGGNRTDVDVAALADAIGDTEPEPDEEPEGD